MGKQDLSVLPQAEMWKSWRTQAINKLYCDTEGFPSPLCSFAHASPAGHSISAPPHLITLFLFLRLEEPTTRLLSEIFSSLEPELRGFLDVCNKTHPFSCLQVLVTLSDSVFEMWGSSSAPPSSFLNTVLGNMLLLAKSSFNKCIVSVGKSKAK